MDLPYSVIYPALSNKPNANWKLGFNMLSRAIQVAVTICDTDEIRLAVLRSLLSVYRYFDDQNDQNSLEAASLFQELYLLDGNDSWLQQAPEYLKQAGLPISVSFSDFSSEARKQREFFLFTSSSD
jgi:hypothetical protein